MLEPYNSRQDMDIDELRKKIHEFKKDHRISKEYKWQEVKRLTAIIRWLEGEWEVRSAHESDASVDDEGAVVYNNHSNHDGQQGAVNAYLADSRWYLRRRPRLHS